MSRLGLNSNNYARFGLTSIRQWNPCCCMSLSTGAKYIAIAQMFLSLMWIITVGAIFIVIVARQHVMTLAEMDQLKGKFGIGLDLIILVLVVGILLLGLEFFLHLYLFKGIMGRDLAKVNRWWTIMAVITLFTFIFSLASVKPLGRPLVDLSEIVVLIFDIYSLWVINAFRRELGEGVDHTVEFERVL